MILNTVQIVVDWLAGDTTDAAGADQGVNAALEALGSAGLFAPERPPAIVAVLDETRHRTVAEGKVPEHASLPILFVTQNSPADVAPEVRSVTRDADAVELAIRYLGHGAEPERATQAALQTMRAVVRSLRELLRSQNEAQRQRNGIQILSATRMQYGLVGDAIGGLQVQAALIVAFEVRDIAP